MLVGSVQTSGSMETHMDTSVGLLSSSGEPGGSSGLFGSISSKSAIWTRI
ncbi:MAG: hypothetical protein NTU88_12385 [Armatimonadetes bacterium]|nr:hypothetical protein [Armatimonadota bacterium]